MKFKRILTPLLIILLLLSIVVMGAPTYVNVGPTTSFDGDVGVPSGKGYYINEVAVKLSDLAATTSAELAGVISDETGTDKLVYNTSPTLVTPVLGVAAATSINLTGGQIAFPAAQNPSANANTLDDYEEGTWTPVITFGGASVDMTYSTQAGLYTKIGRQVTVTGRIVLSAKGTSTGAAIITGLPFPCENDEGAYSAVTLKLGVITFANAFQGMVRMNTSQIDLQEVTEAGAITVLDNTDFANTSNIIMMATYFIN